MLATCVQPGVAERGRGGSPSGYPLHARHDQTQAIRGWHAKGDGPVMNDPTHLGIVPASSLCHAAYCSSRRNCRAPRAKWVAKSSGPDSLFHQHMERTAPTKAQSTNSCWSIPQMSLQIATRRVANSR